MLDEQNNFKMYFCVSLYRVVRVMSVNGLTVNASRPPTSLSQMLICMASCFFHIYCAAQTPLVCVITYHTYASGGAWSCQRGVFGAGFIFVKTIVHLTVSTAWCNRASELVPSVCLSVSVCPALPCKVVVTTVYTIFGQRQRARILALRVKYLGAIVLTLHIYEYS